MSAVRPVPSRPPITRICCVNCGVENSIFDPTHNLCCGCEKPLFRVNYGKPGKVDRTFQGIYVGGIVVALLAAGWGWLVLVILGLLALPLYALFYVSPPAGVVAVLLLTAWLLHRVGRPDAVERRRENQRRQRIRRELRDISDDLPPSPAPKPGLGHDDLRCRNAE